MANTKSAQKRAVTNEKRRQKNVARMSDVKTFVKKVMTSLEAKDVTKSKDSLKEAESKLAKAVKKGILKKNSAARKVSRLSKKIAVLEKNK